MTDAYLSELAFYPPSSVKPSVTGWQPKGFSFRALLFFMQNIDFNYFPKKIIFNEKPMFWSDISWFSRHNDIGFAIKFKTMFLALIGSKLLLLRNRVRPEIENLGRNQDERKV